MKTRSIIGQKLKRRTSILVILAILTISIPLIFLFSWNYVKNSVYNMNVISDQIVDQMNDGWITTDKRLLTLLKEFDLTQEAEERSYYESLISNKLTELAATAVTGVPHTHDLGRFNGRSFLYVAAFGAFTEIAYSTPQKAKNLLGYNAYILEVVKNLASIKPYHIKVEWEDQVLEGDYLYGMVSNTTSVGRFRNFPPGNPDLSDGLLEVTLISPIRDVKDMEEFSRALLMTDPSILNSMMTTFSTAKVKITAAAELLWTLDGEAGGAHQTVEIEAIPHAYTIIHGK